MKPTPEQVEHLATVAQIAHVDMMKRAKLYRPDGFTVDELRLATREAWRAVVKAVFA